MIFWLKDDLSSKKMVVQRAILFSGITLFVLFVFQPFGTLNSTISYKFLRLSGYGLVTFCAFLISGTLEITLSRYKLNNRLRLVVILCLQVGIAAVFNHSYYIVAITGALHLQNQLSFVLFTLAFGILPVSIMYFINRYGSIPTQPQQAIEPVNHPKNNNEPLNIFESVESPLITLTGDNKSDKLQVELSQLLFIKSADNYCELTILSDNKVSKRLLRSSLTSILKQLPCSSTFQRCHRSYAVNLALVDLSTGNAGGLQLLMKPIDVTIPVSRSYVDVIKQALLIVPKAC